MKKVFYFLILFLFMLLPTRTNAVYDVIDSRCTKKIKTELREDGQDITYRITKVTKEDEVTYTLILYNITDQMYITDKEGTKYDDTKITDLKPGTTFVVNVYASNKSYCEGYKITSKIINIPYYNKYSTSTLCNGYEKYFLCKEDSNVKLSEQEFEKQMKEYIDSLKVKETEKKEEEKKEIEDNFDFLEFVDDYKYYIIGGVALISIVVISIVIYNKHKNRGIL